MAIRLRTFEFLTRQQQIHGELLPVQVLRDGFDFQGVRITLMSPQGIHKPRAMGMPLTITTIPPEPGRSLPYHDQVQDGLLIYCYRGTDSEHRDNAGLRRVMQERMPLVYLYGIVPGRYYPIYPVFIVADNPSSGTFAVAVEDATFVQIQAEISDGDCDARRRYVTRLTKQRLHQEVFRERVLEAYTHRCAICHLRHTELLDAAHILPDSDEQGLPVVPNGLALCKLHHAAFDANLVGIRPDLVIELREDIRRETDGPMLQYGIQAFHEKPIWVPRSDRLKPAKDRLEKRYGLFRASA